jgi:hypothetical protein
MSEERWRDINESDGQERGGEGRNRETEGEPVLRQILRSNMQPVVIFPLIEA